MQSLNYAKLPNKENVIDFLKNVICKMSSGSLDDNMMRKHPASINNKFH